MCGCVGTDPGRSVWGQTLVGACGDRPWSALQVHIHFEWMGEWGILGSLTGAPLWLLSLHEAKPRAKHNIYTRQLKRQLP